MEVGKQADKPKFLTSRETHQQDTIIEVGDVKIGGKHSPVLIAGPCAIESKEQVEMTAEFVASRGVKIFRGGAYKPRSNPYSFQGLGEEGLKIGREACDKYNLLFDVEIMDAADLDLFVEYADILQVGARNSQNFTLLKAIGKTTKPVLLKTRAKLHHRRVGYVGGVPDERRQRQRHPLRARHPHLRAVHPQYLRRFGSCAWQNKKPTSPSSST